MKARQLIFSTRRLAAALVATVAICLGSTTASAITIIGDVAGSESGLGDFSADFVYTPSSDTLATLVIALTNTTPVANGGFLTSFAFNNPDDSITDASLSSTSATFNTLLFGDNTINAAPFGMFDVGSSTDGEYLGGGAPSAGIGVGDTETFTFDFTGINLDLLDENSFMATHSAAQGCGGGEEPGGGKGSKGGPKGSKGGKGGKGEEETTDDCGETEYSFVTRFRGFDNGGSDKVPGIIEEDPEDPIDINQDPNDLPQTPSAAMPEPITTGLLAMGIGALVLRRRRR